MRLRLFFARMGTRSFFVQARNSKSPPQFRFDGFECGSPIREHHHQMIKQVGRFANEVGLAFLARFSGGFDHFGGFLGDLVADLRHPSLEQLRGIRTLRGVLLPVGDDCRQLLQDARG